MNSKKNLDYHFVAFGEFASNELAIRIDDAKPKVIISASCGIEGKNVLPSKPLMDIATKSAAHKPLLPATIVYERKPVGTPGRIFLYLHSHQHG